MKNNRSIRRAASIGIAASALAGLAVVGATAQAAPAEAAPFVTEDAAICTVTDGTLTWGVKESFRSYISGSIANGSWEATEGATYETPHFTWSGGTGEIDPETGTGSISFTGTVHFTGHDGVLDLTLANPTIEFEGDGSAALMLDARSTDVEGEVTVDAQQEWIGAVEAPTTLPIENDALIVDGMATTLTNSGVKAFAEFYEAGDELDPIAIDVAFTSCDASGTPTETDEPEMTTQAPAEETEAAPAEPEPSIPWLPIIIGGVAILVIGVTTGMLITGRKKPGAGAHGNGAGQDPSLPSGE